MCFGREEAPRSAEILVLFCNFGGHFVLKASDYINKNSCQKPQPLFVKKAETVWDYPRVEVTTCADQL